MPGSDLAQGLGRSVASCTGLHADYRTAAGVAPALVDVDASFTAGRFSVVAGPSGSGKSTLLRVLAGLMRPRAGSVDVGGTELTRLRTGALRRLRRRHMGIVLQDPADNLVDYLSTIEQVELAARLRGVDPGEASDLLEAVSLGHRAHNHAAELSGGEQQRTSFAAAAIGGPTLLLADEPTAQLDSASGRSLVASMRSLVERGVTLIVTSHDPVVIDAADDVVLLHDGKVASR